MASLINTFKREHAKIIAMLNEVKELGVLSKKGQARLISIKKHLLAHLKNEDVIFYPVLYKEAEYNERLKSTLDLFVLDMEKISDVVQEFFEKYSEGAFDEELLAVFERLLEAFKERAKNEEDALYEEYDKIMEVYRTRIQDGLK